MFDITSDKVYVKTFGGFDLYYQGELIYFSSSKAKELLAILVDWSGKEVTLSHLPVFPIYFGKVFAKFNENFCQKC